MLRVLIGCCPRSIRVQINGWRVNLFSLFCSTWRAVLKVFVRLFRTKASETLEKCLRGGILKKMEKRRQKEFLTTWGCVNNKKSSQQFPSCVIATRLQNVFAIILTWTRKEVEKLFEETVYKYIHTYINFIKVSRYLSAIKKKRRSRVWDLYNA